MTVAAQPRPAALPLPGGRPGATVRLHPLLAGEFQVPPRFFDRPRGRLGLLRGLGVQTPRSRWLWIPVPAFLIEHPGAGAILVDTGLHPSVAIDPSKSFGRIGRLVNRVRMTPDQALHPQLRARGVEPGDVRVIVMTHLHLDHASGVSEFPDATFVVDGREWEAATAPRGLPRGYYHSHFDHAFDWRTLDYGAAEVDSFATFGQAIDLFGDGSVRVLSTPGHSFGHQSVLLRLGDREALLAGDAAYSRRTIEEDLTPLFLADEHRFRRSLGEVRRFAEQTPGALVIPGHDPETWPDLEDTYA